MTVGESALYDVDVIRDVVYGRGGVNFNAENKERDLTLDVYNPRVTTTELRPAIILAFGGAFHKGSKEDDSFTVGEGQNTSVSWYAHHWASMGFVTFSIDYRLVPEDPDPGDTPVLCDLETAGTERMLAVRTAMGLGPTTNQLLANGIEAGSDDMAKAARFVQSHSEQWHVDPQRIGLWGWSAGARNALHAVFIEGFPAACLVALSPYVHQRNLKVMLDRPKYTLPVLVASAERDLPHIRNEFGALVDGFNRTLPSVEGIILRDIDHFYPSTSVVDQESDKDITLEQAMTSFLVRTLSTPSA